MTRTWGIVIYSAGGLVTSAIIAATGFVAGRRSAIRAIALNTHVIQTTDMVLNGKKVLKSAKLIKRDEAAIPADA
jgi:hypothetical protein